MKLQTMAIFCLALSWMGIAFADPPIELVQDREAVLEDQRLVGNSRAQAKRRGTIRSTPQLYVYHADQRAAFHLEDYREGYTRYLEKAVRGFREERSMVDLDKLLERAHRPDDSGTDVTTRLIHLTPEDLPARDLTIVFYYSSACADCDPVELELAEWLNANNDLNYNYIRISVNH